MKHTVKNLIIGAGPSGLAVAGRLAKIGQPFTLLEKGTHIGEAWHHHYDRLHLHTDRQFSGLPHRPISKDMPVFVPRLDLIRYWEEYAGHFEIKPQFGQEVGQITRSGNGWLTTTLTDTFASETVVVCTGYNRIPNIPKWPGQEKFRGTILHSSQYKNPLPYAGKRILVVGMGNSGAEIALDLCNQHVETSISLRSPVNIVTRDIGGKPTQLSAIVMSTLLPDWAYDRLSKIIQKKVIGDLSPYGIRTPDYAPTAGIRRGHVPVLDIGTVAKVKSGEIRIRRDIEHFLPTGVQFVDGTHLDVDAVILATGYRALLGEFVPEIKPLLNDRGCPSQLWYEGFPGLYFLGFGVPLTGILRGIKLDSRKIVDHLLRGK
jgi:hypothetical protein